MTKRPTFLDLTKQMHKSVVCVNCKAFLSLGFGEENGQEARHNQILYMFWRRETKQKTAEKLYFESKQINAQANIDSKEASIWKLERLDSSDLECPKL